MRHAHIYKMIGAGTFRRADGFDPRALIDLYELLGFCGTRVRDTHQLNEGIASREVSLVGRAVERIA